MTVQSISFQALQVKQPIGSFYIGVIQSRDLLKISFADVRRLEKEREFETYLGIQRPLSPKRVKEISEYVRTVDATFPSSIIIAVDGRCAQWDENGKTLTLQEFVSPDPSLAPHIPFSQVAKILDGQHRIAGLEEYAENNFFLNVTIFIDVDIAEQANIFATVNLAQTKVNKSLVYDLFELAKARSPQKTCHNIAVALDSNGGSPFFKMIKRLGTATEGRFTETITQATFVEALMRYISPNPMGDRDILLRGKALPYPSQKELQSYIFRSLFVEEKDADITKIIWAYFDAIKTRWPYAWSTIEQGNILNRTNGFRAFMRVLKPIYLALSSPGELVGKSQFLKELEKVDLKDADFNSERFLPGTGGESALVAYLTNKLFPDPQISLIK